MEWGVIKAILMEPSITDWLQTGAAIIGVPALLIGLWKLVSKDKDKQKQIDSLSSLATSHQESIQELTKQTGEFKYQSSLMKESNEILAKQVGLQNEMFLHQKTSEQGQRELRDLERIRDIKPHFIFNGTSLSPDEYRILLLNKGAEAKNVQLAHNQEQTPKIKLLEPGKNEYATDKTLTVFCNVSIKPAEANSRAPIVNFQLLFEDSDGNKYEQTVIGSEVGAPRLK